MSQTNYRVRRSVTASVRRFGAVAALGALLAGCSADIARFQQPPTFNLTEGGKGTGSTTPPAGMRSADRAPAFDTAAPLPQPSGNSIYSPPRAERPSRVELSALPEPKAQASTPPPRVQLNPPRPAPRSVGSEPVAAPAVDGATITVQSGDTLYGLSKKHRVSISELMSVNGLTSPAIRPGQQLKLPSGAGASQLATTTPVRPARKPAQAAAVGLDASSEAARDGEPGTHTIRPGDSLYKIARQHNTTVAKLKAANGNVEERSLRPGRVLRLPGSDSGPQVASAEARAPSLAPAAPSRVQTGVGLAARSESVRPAGGPAKEPAGSPGTEIAKSSSAPPSDGARGGLSVVPTIVNGAAATATDAPAPAAPAKPVQVAEIRPEPAVATLPPMAGKLRWPAKGRVISGFGARADGSHNDGINLAVPLGTEVHAAEGGVVAYAGDELKGYGNLVLVRHDNGWVTAYAHNDQLLVKRGDKVRRGQVIAKAGKTGTVDQPQVHFELRMGSKPVDPLPYMEKG